MNDTPLMAMINAASERFEKRPEYRASDATRAELQMLGQLDLKQNSTTAAVTGKK